MKNNNSLIRVLSVFEVIIGIFIIYINIKIRYEQLDRIMKEPEYSWNDVSWFGFFKTQQYMLIVGFLFIVAGTLLYLYRKAGWHTSLAAWLTFGLTSLIVLKPNTSASTSLTMPNSGYWAFGIFSLLTLAIIILLLTKSVRERYSVNKTSWIYLFLILMFFFLNKQLIG